MKANQGFSNSSQSTVTQHTNRIAVNVVLLVMNIVLLLVNIVLLNETCHSITLLFNCYFI